MFNQSFQNISINRDNKEKIVAFIRELPGSNLGRDAILIENFSAVH
jgi:hypothetical protein